MSELPAIEGGKPTRAVPLRFKPWITDDDINLVIDVLKSGQLSALVVNGMPYLSRN